MHIQRLNTACLALTILLCVAAAGCLGVKTPPVSHIAAPAVFVDYHRSGGITGVDDRLVIFDNGAAVAATNAGSRDIALNSTELQWITALFEKAQFSMLQENYPASHGSADLFHYSISYHGKTITLDESAFPVTVQPVINELDKILSSVQLEQVLGTGPQYQSFITTK